MLGPNPCGRRLPPSGRGRQHGPHGTVPRCQRSREQRRDGGSCGDPAGCEQVTGARPVGGWRGSACSTGPAESAVRSVSCFAAPSVWRRMVRAARMAGRLNVTRGSGAPGAVIYSRGAPGARASDSRSPAGNNEAVAVGAHAENEHVDGPGNPYRRKVRRCPHPWRDQVAVAAGVSFRAAEQSNVRALAGVGHAAVIDEGSSTRAIRVPA